LLFIAMAEILKSIQSHLAHEYNQQTTFLVDVVCLVGANGLLKDNDKHIPHRRFYIVAMRLS
jgi:hypothetical protein